MNFSGRAMLVLVLMLGGCASSSSDTTKALPDRLAKNGFVDAIDVKSVPADVSPEFKATLASELQASMKACARGKVPLRLQVSVGEVKRSNPAATVLIGDSNVIRGTAQLIDPASGEVVGDYDISRSAGWGGLIAAAYLSINAEDKMATAFADEICKRAFGHAPGETQFMNPDYPGGVCYYSQCGN